MTEAERLRDELELAEASEVLEAAREAMHSDATPKNVKAYKRASKDVAEIRTALREKYPPVAANAGDAAATPATVKASGKVQKPR